MAAKVATTDTGNTSYALGLKFPNGDKYIATIAISPHSMTKGALCLWLADLLRNAVLLNTEEAHAARLDVLMIFALLDCIAASASGGMTTFTDWGTTTWDQIRRVLCTQKEANECGLSLKVFIFIFYLFIY